MKVKTAGVTRSATSGKGLRLRLPSFGHRQYFDAGRDRADLGALGASRAAVFEDDEGCFVTSGCGAYGPFGAGLQAGATAGAGVRHGEDRLQER